MDNREQVDELRSCCQDPIYFIKNYVKISSPITGVIAFNLYDFQEQIVKDFFEHRFNIVKKSRQLGLTTTQCAIVFWLCYFFTDKRVLFVSPNLTMAKGAHAKFKFMHDHLPKWLKIQKITHSTSTSIDFSNGSSIRFIVANPVAGRGEAADLLILDEFAWFNESDVSYLALYASLKPNGRMLICSSTKEQEQEFEKLLVDPNNEFNKTHLFRDEQLKQVIKLI